MAKKKPEIIDLFNMVDNDQIKQCDELINVSQARVSRIVDNYIQKSYIEPDEINKTELKGHVIGQLQEGVCTRIEQFGTFDNKEESMNDFKTTDEFIDSAIDDLVDIVLEQETMAIEDMNLIPKKSIHTKKWFKNNMAITRREE